jgi:MFS family permease
VGDVVKKEMRAKAMSLYNSTASVASIISPITMSLAISKTGFRTAFVIIDIAAIAGFLLVLFGIRTHEVQTDS